MSVESGMLQLFVVPFHPIMSMQEVWDQGIHMYAEHSVQELMASENIGI